MRFSDRTWAAFLGVIVVLPALIALAAWWWPGIFVLALAALAAAVIGLGGARKFVPAEACEGCGYDLTLNDTGTCPECGGPAVRCSAVQFDGPMVVIGAAGLLVLLVITALITMQF